MSEPTWKVKHIATGDQLAPEFHQKYQAEEHIKAMGDAFVSLFEAVPVTDNPKQYRMLTEGLVKGDLRRILLPQVSVDEFIPGDPSTDNVVFAFFIKGVSDAVIPFRDFVMKSRGVIDVAHGDSDTIPDTSIVYAEMSRKNFKFVHIEELMEYVAMLAELDVEDFSLMFPSSRQRYPYSKETMETYFDSRTRKQNWEAQKQATEEPATEEQTEAMVEALINVMGAPV